MPPARGRHAEVLLSRGSLNAEEGTLEEVTASENAALGSRTALAMVQVDQGGQPATLD
jgi:hypothetical protein